MADTGKKKYTAEELKAMDPAVLAGIILVLQDQIEALNAQPPWGQVPTWYT